MCIIELFIVSYVYFIVILTCFILESIFIFSVIVFLGRKLVLVEIKRSYDKAFFDDDVG